MKPIPVASTSDRSRSTPTGSGSRSPSGSASSTSSAGCARTATPPTGSCRLPLGHPRRRRGRPAHPRAHEPGLLLREPRRGLRGLARGLSSFGGLLFAVPAGSGCPPPLPRAGVLGRALDIAVPVLMAAGPWAASSGPQLMVAGGGHPTHQWFGMYYAGQAGRRIPCPIIQAIEDFSVFVLLLVIERRARPLARRHPPRRATRRGRARHRMILWGIARSLDEHLWLGEDGRLGSLLVQLAGVLLVVGGVVILVRTWSRWTQWLTARITSRRSRHEQLRTPPNAGPPPPRAASGLSLGCETRRPGPGALALTLDRKGSPSRKIQPIRATGASPEWRLVCPGLRLVDLNPHRSAPFSSDVPTRPSKGACSRCSRLAGRWLRRPPRVVDSGAAPSERRLPAPSCNDVAASGTPTRRIAYVSGPDSIAKLAARSGLPQGLSG